MDSVNDGMRIYKNMGEGSQQRNINVIIVQDFGFILGGAQRVAIDEAIALSIEGYGVTYFCGVGPVDPRLEKACERVVCLHDQELNKMLGSVKNKLNGAMKGLWNRKAQRAFSELLDQFDPSNTIVHFHSWSQVLSASPFRETAVRKLKTLITCHDYEIACPGRIYYDFGKCELCQHAAMTRGCYLENCDKRGRIQKIYRLLRQRILLNLLKRNDLSLIYLNELSKNIVSKDFHINCDGFVIQNLVDIPQPRDITPQNNRKYIFIGRDSPEKGIDFFCEAVSRANVEATIIGVSDESEERKRKYPTVSFIGWVSPDEMDRHIADARCLIVSSQWVETGPLTVPETQCGYFLPCIVPNLCGVTKDVIEAGSGLTYETWTN